MNDELMKAEGITRRYGPATVLRDVSFALKRGEVLGLFGPNGAGKTTLLDMVALASRPDVGRIMIDGTDAASALSALRRRIGYVPQEIALFEELTVRENLLCWSKLPGREAKAKAQSVAEQLNLTPLMKKKVASLSGGMKRRVNIAVALLGNPTLLVLDEPFAGVDTDNAEVIGELLKSMSGQGVAQIISGHSPEQLMPFLDRIMVLNAGEIAFLGDCDAFLKYGEGSDAKTALKTILHGADA